MTMAAIITSIWRAMPTAVITESSENTISITAIWAMTTPKPPQIFAGSALVPAFQVVVDFHRGLADQEQATTDQHDVAPGNRLAPDGEQRLVETGQPGDDEQQREARDQRRAEAEPACCRALTLREPVCENGNEDKVVDAEHDLKRGQRGQADPERSGRPEGRSCRRYPVSVQGRPRSRSMARRSALVGRPAPAFRSGAERALSC